MSDLQPKTVVVNGREYMISKFFADTGIKVFLRLAKIIAEPMAKGASIANLPQDSAEFLEGVSEVMGALAMRLNEQDIILTVEDLLSVVIPPGQTYPLADPLNPSRSNWKIHFQGRLADLSVVLYETVKENFDDFLFVVKLARKRLDAARAKEPASRSQST